MMIITNQSLTHHVVTEVSINTILCIMTIRHGEIKVVMNHLMYILTSKRSKRMRPTFKGLEIVEILLPFSLKPYTKIWMINPDPPGHRSTQVSDLELLNLLYRKVSHLHTTIIHFKRKVLAITASICTKYRCMTYCQTYRCQIIMNKVSLMIP